MSRGGKDITTYARYFNLKAPGAAIGISLLLLLGFITGLIASLLIHYKYSVDPIRPLLSGAAAGVLAIGFPALLTSFLIKSMRRRIRFKHILFATLAISLIYSLFIIIDAAVYALFGNQTLPYVILILGNAGIYGYWFFINKIAVGQRKSAVLTASIQPVINILMYIPLSKYLLNIGVPVDTVLIKLYGGIFVFMVTSYAIIYLLDRPAKEELNVSGVALLSSMIGGSLYNLAMDTSVLGKGGVKRDLDVQVVALKGKAGYKAFFINPDIHYGPFRNVGGSVFPAYMGNLIASKYKAAPFTIHSAVNIDDNPMSNSETMRLSNSICSSIDKLDSRAFENASGSFRTGRKGTCAALSISINDTSLIMLTRAPAVTEDIERSIGIGLRNLAGAYGKNAVIVDSHNSRFESAPKEELLGLYQGSSFVPMYTEAVKKALSASQNKQLSFGSSHKRIAPLLRNNRDLGPGYTSVGVFEFGGRKRLCLVFFDANNMLPGFRAEILSHIKKKFGLDAELCTTDTHSVNSISLAASNSLGRITTATQLLPILDDMVEAAIKSIEPVKATYFEMSVKRFHVWGAGSRDEITKVGLRIIRRVKYVVPFLIVAAFIIAAWIIYIV